MLKFHSTGELGVTKAEVFFPNKRGASVLKTKRFGEPDLFDVTLMLGTQGKSDIDPSTCILTDEIGCDEMLEKIRILSPD